MISAWQSMVPANVGVTSGYLTNVTHNRRAGTSPGDSPYVTSGTIDPHMGILRVDDTAGNPIATVWNYACHGTHVFYLSLSLSLYFIFPFFSHFVDMFYLDFKDVMDLTT